MLTGIPLWLGEVYAVVFGLVIGSFLAVCIRRLPEDRSLLTPSACPRCGARVRWRDNVPVVSWLVLRGRCRDCGAPISPSYPLTELLTALVAWLLFRRIVQDPTDLDLGHFVGWLGRFTFLALLIVAAFVDLRHRIVPDQTSIYAVPVGIAFAALGEWLGWDGFGAVGWRAAVLGAAIWGASFAVFSMLASWIAGRDALGWGDVKLVAMFGAFLGAYPGTFVSVLLGSLSGAVVGLGVLMATRQRPHLPFAPPLAIGAATWVLWGDVLLGGLYR